VPRRLILASSSPRRKELLSMMGLSYVVFSPDVEEDGEGLPGEVVMLHARKKAQAAALIFPGDVVLAADTVVFAAGQVLGKPRDPGDASRMLSLLSGRVHQVYTGVCVVSGEKLIEGTAVTDVRFSRMSEEEIAFYCASGEPLGKAGAYAIQGLGGMFVEEISGSYSNVVGLPTALVRSMLQDASYPIFRRE